MTSPFIRRALLSVSDKSQLAEFARGLVDAGVELYASGGTRQHLESAGLKVQEISAYTGFPEMMDGRLKTLHPKIHGGILCRHDRADDRQSMEQHGIVPFELVVVNFYPFEKTVARPDVEFAEAIEQIDIGGPSLVRGAAKNHAFTTVVTSPDQYPELLAQLRAQGATTPELRRRFAATAFELTARYDRLIADYFARSVSPATTSVFPERVQLALTLVQTLRYGENPHQPAAVYACGSPRPGQLISATLLHGKELSYNNLLDLNSALAVVRGWPAPAVSVIKHNNPCGAATHGDLATATRAALDGDPQSAFGSVIGVNRILDGAAAAVLCEPGRFVEAIVAPEFDRAAIEVLTTKPKWKENVRLLSLEATDCGGLGTAQQRTDREYRAIDGGFLAQSADNLPDEESAWNVVTNRQPDERLLSELRFAWAMVRHVKSNAIVLSVDGALCGVGAGQMSRVDSVEIAIKKAGPRAVGAVLASDAFFPFADSIHAAAAAGVAAIIQPGGSRRDEEVVAACNQHGIPMIFTGRRHFRH